MGLYMSLGPKLGYRARLLRSCMYGMHSPLCDVHCCSSVPLHSSCVVLFVCATRVFVCVFVCVCVCVCVSE